MHGGRTGGRNGGDGGGGGGGGEGRGRKTARSKSNSRSLASHFARVVGQKSEAKRAKAKEDRASLAAANTAKETAWRVENLR